MNLKSPIIVLPLIFLAMLFGSPPIARVWLIWMEWWMP